MLIFDIISGAESFAGRASASLIRNVCAEWHLYITLLAALGIGYIAAKHRGASPLACIRSRSFRLDATYAAIDLLHLSHYFVLVPLTVAINWVVASYLPWIKIDAVATLPGLIQGLIYFVIVDLWTYWYHRIQHRIPFFWQFHKTHHSQEQLTPLSVFRITLIDRCMNLVMLAFPIAVLGVSYTIPLSTLIILQFHQLIIHSDIGWTFGPFGRFVVSPSFHEVHHSTAPEHLNRNYGAALAIWDYLFSTQAERNAKFLSYGLISEKLPESYFGQFFVPLIGVFKLAMKRSQVVQ